MPFAVFRRHQRKLIAIFGILAMFAFVVADSLPRLLSGGQAGGTNPEVVKIYGRSVRRSDINRMAVERNDVNMFFAELWALIAPGSQPLSFGPITTDAMVDALILEHEADRLGIPTSPTIGRSWLKRQRFAPILTTDLFELILKRYNNRIGGEQLLGAISNQVRLANVRQLLGSPAITPLDVFETFRDQNEKVSARAVAFATREYYQQAGEPSSSEALALYDKYKSVEPDPSSPTPGFKIPRRVKVEILSIDGEALMRSIKDQITEADLLATYEARKQEFSIRSELPDDIFGPTVAPLPPLVQSFADIRPYLHNTLAEERMKAEIQAKFTKLSDEEISPFAEEYADVLDKVNEAKEKGRTANVSLPEPKSLKEAAQKAGLDYEMTDLLTRGEADNHGAISTAAMGLDRLSEGRKFGDELFDPKPRLHEPLEFTDAMGRRYLVRKLDDQAPRIPSFKEVETDVVLAWKSEHARQFAEKAANELAEKLRKAGGKIEGEIVDGHPVINTDLISRLQPSLLPNQMFGSSPTEILQIPYAGPTLREAYFDLKPGEVTVASNEPKTTYYVMVLKDRIPATFEQLYGLSGEYERFQTETFYEAMRKQSTEWMNELRASAGLPPGWSSKEDSKSG
jgi:peptidyl-prolyl cis-trans isomerase D